MRFVILVLVIIWLGASCGKEHKPSVFDGSQIQTPDSLDRTFDFELDGHLILVQVIVNNTGEARRFAVDSGAAFTVLNNELAAELEIEPESIEMIQSIPGSNLPLEKVGFASLDSLCIVDLCVLNTGTGMFSFDGIAQTGRQVPDGILGNSFLSLFKVTIDYRSKKITFSRNYNRNTAVDATILSFDQGMIPFVIDGNITVPGVIDTGAMKTILPYNLLDKLDYPSTERQEITGYTGGGAFGLDRNRACYARVNRFDIGDTRTQNLPLKFSELGIDNLILGYDILSRFKMTLNYQRRELELEKYPDVGFWDNIYTTGLEIARKEDSAEIIQLVVGSPADLAGIKVGERIESINGTSTSRLSYREICDVLDDVGISVIELEISNETGKREVILTKKNLFPTIEI